MILFEVAVLADVHGRSCVVQYLATLFRYDCY